MIREWYNRRKKKNREAFIANTMWRVYKMTPDEQALVVMGARTSVMENEIALRKLTDWYTDTLNEAIAKQLGRMLGSTETDT